MQKFYATFIQLLFDQDIIDHTVTETNQYALEVMGFPVGHP